MLELRKNGYALCRGASWWTHCAVIESRGEEYVLAVHAYGSPPGLPPVDMWLSLGWGRWGAEERKRLEALETPEEFAELWNDLSCLEGWHEYKHSICCMEFEPVRAWRHLWRENAIEKCAELSAGNVCYRLEWRNWYNVRAAVLSRMEGMPAIYGALKAAKTEVKPTEENFLQMWRFVMEKGAGYKIEEWRGAARAEPVRI